ncbi:unnamed protein product, partial [Discosporangium mesarthrocarpum]
RRREERTSWQGLGLEANEKFEKASTPVPNPNLNPKEGGGGKGIWKVSESLEREEEEEKERGGDKTCRRGRGEGGENREHKGALQQPLAIESAGDPDPNPNLNHKATLDPSDGVKDDAGATGPLGAATESFRAKFPPLDAAAVSLPKLPLTVVEAGAGPPRGPGSGIGTRDGVVDKVADEAGDVAGARAGVGARADKEAAAGNVTAAAAAGVGAFVAAAAALSLTLGSRAKKKEDGTTRITTRGGRDGPVSEALAGAGPGAGGQEEGKGDSPGATDPTTEHSRGNPQRDGTLPPVPELTAIGRRGTTGNRTVETSRGEGKGRDG